MGATTTAKRTPARRSSTRKSAAPKPTPKPVAAAPLADGHFEPIRIVTPEQPPEQELVELFSIDGKSYFVPKHPPPAVALRFIKTAWVVGMELALAEMLQTMLGEEAYDALAECDAMTVDQLGAIMQGVRRLSMGALEGPKGSGSRSA
jgi:hypothetical protein